MIDNVDGLSGREILWTSIRLVLGWLAIMIPMIFITIILGIAMKDAKTKKIEDIMERIEFRLDRIEKAVEK